MGERGEVVVRDAVPDDVPAVCRFGATHIRPHYAPLIGDDAAQEQVRTWWDEETLRAVVAAGLVVVAQADGELVGVGQRGGRGPDHVIYKLYVHPGRRGSGIGPRLVGALAARLPPEAERLHVEHFAANERAGAFYEREGFAVERVEPSATGDRRRDVVWRVRTLVGR